MPVLVDAAAEILTVPNVHLENGATLVGYSGGKCLRGPQSAGLLLGRKDLVQAAWVHSAPHHGFARSMKVGKEEAIGMLMAVEMWTRRDHKAEWSRWLGWLDHIAKQVSRIDGVTTADHGNDRVVEPHAGAVDPMGRRTARDHRRGGRETSDGHRAAHRHAGRTRPRRADEHLDHAVPDGARRREDRRRADPRDAGESARIRMAAPAPAPAPPAGDLSGRWNVRIEYVAGASTHTLHLKQTGNRVEGTHQGDFVSRDLSGTIDGDRVQLVEQLQPSGTATR